MKSELSTGRPRPISSETRASEQPIPRPTQLPRYPGKFRSHEMHGSLNVVLFSAAFIVNSGAQSGTAKIEAKNRNAKGIERFRCLIDDFVVKRAAKEGVRMT